MVAAAGEVGLQHRQAMQRQWQQCCGAVVVALTKADRRKSLEANKENN